MAGPFRYKAFISYSWKDRKAAERLHRELETFRVPKALVGRQTPRGPVPARLAPIFRDRDEEPAGGNLRSAIETALDEAETLIVICSPNAANSKWVPKEVAHFRRLRPDNVLPYVVTGEPHASEIPGREADECFPRTLLFEDRDGVEVALEPPLAADARASGDGPRVARLKIAAAMLGVGLDELVQRDLQRRARRMRFALAGMSGVAAALAGLFVFAMIQRNEAREQRNIATIERANAERQRDTATAALNYLVSVYKLANPATENPKTITALTILERGAKQIEADLRGQPETQAKLYEALGGVYQNLGDMDEAERLLTLAAAIPEAAIADRLSSESQLASIDLQRRRLDAAKARLDRLETEVASAASSGAISPDRTEDFKMRLAENRALFEYLSGRPAEAAKFYSEALALIDPARPQSVAAAARIATNRGLMLVALRDFTAGRADLDRAADLFRQLYGERHLLTAKATHNIAYAEFESKQLDSAIATMKNALDVYETVLEADHPDLANARKLYGTMLIAAGEPRRAIAALQSAAAGFEAAYGANYYDLGYTLVYLAVAHSDAGDHASAIATLDRAGRIYAKNFEPGGFDFGDLDVYLGVILARAGNRAEGDRRCTAGLKILEATLGSQDAYFREMSGKCATALQ
jgi:hypothetical protein